jgi:hypothetical protein
VAVAFGRVARAGDTIEVRAAGRAFEGSAIAEALVRGELDEALARATSRDTLSLWHLVAERPAAEREAIVTRIEVLTREVPPELRPGVMAAGRSALERWRDEVLIDYWL